MVDDLIGDQKQALYHVSINNSGDRLKKGTQENDIIREDMYKSETFYIYRANHHKLWLLIWLVYLQLWITN